MLCQGLDLTVAASCGRYFFHSFYTTSCWSQIVPILLTNAETFRRSKIVWHFFSNFDTFSLGFENWLLIIPKSRYWCTELIEKCFKGLWSFWNRFWPQEGTRGQNKIFRILLPLDGTAFISLTLCINIFILVAYLSYDGRETV